MDDMLYPNATIMIEYDTFSVYYCENGFIGYCDPMCGRIGDNPMIFKECMKSIEDFSPELQEEIRKTIEERRVYIG